MYRNVVGGSLRFMSSNVICEVRCQVTRKDTFTEGFYKVLLGYVSIHEDNVVLVVYLVRR